MHETEIMVRFSDTDALGHVNNSSYFIYLEEARIRFLEHIGFGNEGKEWNFILASTKCDFINQAYFNQPLTIRTRVSKIGSKSFTLQQDIICAQTMQMKARATSVVVYFDHKRQISERIPESLAARLKENLIHQ